MDENNYMVNNKAPNMGESTYSNKESERKNNSDYSMKGSKSKINLKSKTSQVEISCKYNTNKKFQLNTEELAIHILSCDDCLKELLLHQARQKKLEMELLNNKSGRKKYNKTNKKLDVNNSMAMNPEDFNNLDYDENGSSDSESNDEVDCLWNTMFNLEKMSKKNGKRKKKIRKNSMEEDNESEENDEEDQKDNEPLAESMLYANNVEKAKKKSKKRKNNNKDREKISESESEENSDENNFDNLFMNSKKKKKEQDKKNIKNKKKTKNDDEDDDDDESFNI